MKFQMSSLDVKEEGNIKSPSYAVQGLPVHAL